MSPTVWRKLLNQALSEVGYEIRRKRVEGWHPSNLSRRGFFPRTVVDVGAAGGTPVLYESFPEAFLVLIEPLVECEPMLRLVLRDRAGLCLLTTVGEQDGSSTITVETKRPEKSSLLGRTTLTSTGEPGENRTVPMTTLDTLLDQWSLEPPFGLKIDTEGYELRVLQGASRFLKQTQFVIAEVSVAQRFVAGYSFAEFIDAMHKRGFRLESILRQKTVGEPPELVFLDALFVRT